MEAVRRIPVVVLLACLGVCGFGGTSHADDGGMPPGAISVLALLGTMPVHADLYASYDLGLGIPWGDKPSTTMFSGLPDVPESVSLAGWGLRPNFVAQGRYVGLNVGLNFDFGRSEQIQPGLVYDRSFSLNIYYHSGFNLFFWTGERTPLLLSVGPMLDVLMGPRLRLRHREDGETLGYAQFGRLGEISLVPSGMLAWGRAPLLLHVMAAWHPGIPPFNLQAYTAGEAGGTFAEANPDDPDLGLDRPDNAAEARNSLRRVRPAGGYQIGGGVAWAFGSANDEGPLMTIAVTGQWSRRSYSVATGGFGLGSGFMEEDRRIMVGIGAHWPEGYD